MKNAKLSARDGVMLVVLVILLIGVGYYLGFYVPLQSELSAVSTQSANIDNQILSSLAKATKMKEMQAELDEILARPAKELTEIAPYDNKEVVLNQLYGILAQTEDYSLNFTDPDVQKDGTVRRNISMSFRCADYKAAKAVINALTSSHWRCLVSNLSINSAHGDMMEDGVTVTATITFFEHTGLQKQ